MKIRQFLTVGFLFAFFISCGENDKAEEIPQIDERDNLTVTENILIPSYEGNGVQWGGYDVLQSWTGSPTLSDSDWDKLFERVSFMSPGLVRIMIAPGWNYEINGVYDPSKSEDVLFRILDYCEENNVNVILGEWGHVGGDDIDEEWLNNSIRFLEHLVNARNYTCIKYYNMVNEPNGDWSSIDGNYALWSDLIARYHAAMQEKDLDQQVGMIGPDVAVWGTDLVSWVSRTVTDLDDRMAAYDIHTYPSETEVRSGDYKDMISAYRNAAPMQKPMFMGEVGFKYPAGSELGQENQRRIDADPYASDDSNMFIYDSFYGIDMADVVMQNMLAGYAGVIVWGLDDAQYNIDGGGSTELKRWGFWNILGEEKFENPDDESIRPWFYTMSLMSKYFPAGTRIFEVDLPEKKGLRAIAGEKDGHYTIAIVNSHFGEYTVQVGSENATDLMGLKMYEFVAGDGASFEGAVDEKGFAVPDQTGVDFSFSGGQREEVIVAPRSFKLFTNMPD
jgi:hypothetical protein